MSAESESGTGAGATEAPTAADSLPTALEMAESPDATNGPATAPDEMDAASRIGVKDISALDVGRWRWGPTAECSRLAVRWKPAAGSWLLLSRSPARTNRTRQASPSRIRVRTRSRAVPTYRG